MRKKKKSLIFIITILIMCFGIGYAYLTTTLSINGVTDVDANNWDVYFDNANVTNGSVTGEQEIEAPTITSDTEVEFHVRLKEPGEFYEFTIDAKNDGTIDAMVESISKKVNGGTTIPAYLNYTVTYVDDLEILDNHLLAHESLETYKIRVEYRNDIDPDDLPNAAQSLTLSFGVEYVQSDTNVTSVRTTIYSISNASFAFGSSVPTGITTYDNYADAITAFGHPFFLRHTLGNSIITESYVGFVLNDEVYYLKGGIDESSLITKQIYEANKAVLLSAFGSEKCTDYNTTYYSCIDSTSSVYTIVYATGQVYVSGSGYMCCVDTNGSTCGDSGSFG